TTAQTVPAEKPQANAPKVDQQGALMRNRIGFDNPNAKPLMSIILIDVGSDGLDTGALRSIEFPVTFAIKSDAPEATLQAKLLAQSGYEVLAVTPSGAAEIGAGENSTDTSKALSKIFATIPEAVGLIDPISADMQSSPKLADEVIAALKKSGYGLLTYDIGLNPTDKKARHAGVPSGVVFRVLDAERESGVVIKRYLNRAVLEAQKTGQVIVVGRTYPETVAALFSWSLSAKSATIALAPVSAVLLAQ
ncbi:MAG: divergent polysaccharide deacetylase family protein, partial [Alphaproteobacteria bacterium]|nr:divergent polysaccharide deacetylase family protein [Alphaproteobacteria bacterium]